MAANTSGITRRVKQELPDDLSNVEFETSEDVEVIPSFDSLQLKEDLLRGIYAYGMSGLRSITIDINIIHILLLINRFRKTVCNTTKSYSSDHKRS